MHVHPLAELLEVEALELLEALVEQQRLRDHAKEKSVAPELLRPKLKASRAQTGRVKRVLRGLNLRRRGGA